jgi:hypothetical protein
MRKATYRFCFFFLLLVLAQAVLSQELPTPPSGCSWKKLEDIKGAALIPNGWHFKKEKSKGILAYFITQEDIDKKGRYETGLTIQVFRPPQPNTAEEVAQAVIGMHAEKKELILTWKPTMGVYIGYGWQAKGQSADGSMTRTNGLILSNTQTKTFYLILFESSEAKWEEAWKIGEKITQQIAFNDGI